MSLVPARLRRARAPRRAPTGLELWRRRSRVVRRLRRATPWAIALIAVLVIGWIGIRAILSALAPNELGSDIRMSAPRFYGRDDHGKPFVIAAGKAVRDTRNPDLVTLTDPDLNMDTGAPAPTHVQAKHGLFNDASRMLILDDSVVMDDGRGYHFTSQHAVVNTETTDVDGHAFVTGDGPIGHITAQSYAVRERGVRLIFAGDVHTHLNNTHTSKTPTGAPRR